MSVIIEMPSALQKYTNDEEEVEVNASSVKEAFGALAEKYPEVKQHLYDENGKIRSFINVYLNDEDIRYAENLETSVQDGDNIQVVPSIAGGK